MANNKMLVAAQERALERQHHLSCYLEVPSERSVIQIVCLISVDLVLAIIPLNTPMTNADDTTTPY